MHKLLNNRNHPAGASIRTALVSLVAIACLCATLAASQAVAAKPVVSVGGSSPRVAEIAPWERAEYRHLIEGAQGASPTSPKGTLLNLAGERQRQPYLFAEANQAPKIQLNSVLRGIEKCEDSDALLSVRRFLYQRIEGISADVKPPKDIPNVLLAAIDQAKYADKGGYTEVEIPINGKYNGINVNKLSFSLGTENGILIISVSFGVTQEALLRNIAKMLLAEKIKPASAPYSISISDSDVGATLTCDWSM